MTASHTVIARQIQRKDENGALVFMAVGALVLLAAIATQALVPPPQTIDTTRTVQ